MRFFVTAAQKRYRGTGDVGRTELINLLFFWDFQVICEYWCEIHKHVQNVFSFVFPLFFKTVCPGIIALGDFNHKDKKLLYILVAASKKKPLQENGLNLNHQQIKTELTLFKRSASWKNLIFQEYGQNG